MLNKKVVILIILIVSLFAVSTVTASENVTDTSLGTDIAYEDSSNNIEWDNSSVEKTDDYLSDDIKSFENSNNPLLMSSVENDSLISTSNIDETLGDSLPYTISANGDKTIKMGSTGNVYFTLYYKEYGVGYNYNLIIDICDSYNNPKLSKQFSGTSDGRAAISVGMKINTGSLNAGTYTAKLRDSNNYNNVLASYKFTVYYQLFTVSVSDVAIAYESSNKIYMYVSPTDNSPYPYDYYLKIYDSKNNEILSRQYSDTASKGPITLAYELDYGSTTNMAISRISSGSYTIKIINGYDSTILDTAKLTVGSAPAPNTDYSVDISHNIVYSNEGGKITMNIKPTYSGLYKYNFYLKIYDSKNVEKISIPFIDTVKTSTTVYYSIDANKLAVGDYTIKIIKAQNNKVLNTAKMSLKNKTFTDYSVSVSDVVKNDWDSEFLNIYLTPNSSNDYYNYNIYLKIYNSQNVLKISKEYSGETKGNYVIHHLLDSYGLQPGTYKVEVGKMEYNQIVYTNVKLNVVVPTELVISDSSFIYGSNNKYAYVTLKALNGYNITGAKLSSNFNGFESLTTNDYGQIRMSLFGLNPKTYKISVSFDGKGIFGKSNATFKVVVKKATPKITAKAKTFKKSIKSKKYSVTLKNNQNKAMKNTKVTIKVNGKTYYAKTNSKGTATFKITKLIKKGTFKATVTYAGNKYYNKVTKKINIKCK